MNLFLVMLPVYIGGNLHCLGMCGPLVAILAQNRYRLFYFLGRTLSFTLGAGLAAGAGELIANSLRLYYIPAALSIGFGSGLLVMGWKTLTGHRVSSKTVSSLLEPANKRLSLLLLRDGALPVFLFGLLTVALPCGQTFLVFSACALSADTLTGIGNGFAFALLTSPSLFFAMYLRQFLGKTKSWYSVLLAISTLTVGALSVCRGLAELSFISHWVINHEYHIVMF